MTERMRRVNESVRAVVAEALGELKDPRLGIVTVTGVSVSPDLHDAPGVRVGVRRREEAQGVDGGARVGHAASSRAAWRASCT